MLQPSFAEFKPNTVTLVKVVSRLLLMTLKMERVFVFVDFRIDYSAIDEAFLNNLEASSFQKIGLVMQVWTNDPAVIYPPVEFKVS